MAARAVWKGHLTIDQLICPVALTSAVSTSERVTLHVMNRRTGHRLRRLFVDSVTGAEVDRDAQVKGWEQGPDDYLAIEPEEIAAVLPVSDKRLVVEAFIACSDVDDLYFDKPYYLRPADPSGAEVYALICRGLADNHVAALASAVLFRRNRRVLVRPHAGGLIATMLNFDYAVRSAEEVFQEVPAVKIDAEMLELAQHIIRTKHGRFDPEDFDDRYEKALADLVRAKREGRPIVRPKPQPPARVIDLKEALRASAGLPAGRTSSGKAGGKAAPRRRKAS